MIGHTTLGIYTAKNASKFFDIDDHNQNMTTLLTMLEALKEYHTGPYDEWEWSQKKSTINARTVGEAKAIFATIAAPISEKTIEMHITPQRIIRQSESEQSYNDVLSYLNTKL
jgi:hypothetical protein